MGENKAQELDKVIASINKGADKKEEMRLMMGPYTDWDRYLTPAPLFIAILGQLILISTDTDFSLQDKKETLNFKLLKYPDSFRASLVQVSNSGWGAFNKAHTCMDQIRLYSGNVDKHVKTVVKFLLNGSPKEVELMVPKALKSIENIADECLAAANKVEKEFVFVMEMVAELFEACTRSHGQQELKDVEIQKRVVEEHKKALDEEKKQAQEKKEKMMKEMKAAEDDYKDAMSSMPSTGDLVGLAFTEAVLNAARNVTSIARGGNQTADTSAGIPQQNSGRRMYDKSCDDLAKRSREMGEVLGDLAKIDLQKIDHNTILKTQKRGIKALAELREQCCNLVQFFQMLSNFVKYCLHTSLKTFVETSQSQQMLTEAGCAEQAFQANQIAYVVNSIPSFYVEVSDKYLMERITCLGKLVALDPVKDAREIQLKREELNAGCKEAQEAIKKIALEKKKLMSDALDKRIGRIEAVVCSLLPATSEAEAKQIQYQVKAGIAMGKAATEAELEDWS